MVLDNREMNSLKGISYRRDIMKCLDRSAIEEIFEVEQNAVEDPLLKLLTNRKSALAALRLYHNFSR